MSVKERTSVSEEIEKEENRKIYKRFLVKEEKTEYVVEAEFNEKGYLLNAKLEVYYYPIYPYGNYVKSVLNIENHGDVIVFERYNVRMNWDGTGRDDIGYIEVKDVSEEAPEFLTRDFYEEINSPEEFKEKVETIFEFMKNYIDMLNIL